MGPFDWGVLGAYLIGIVVFGVWMGRGNRGIEDFFLAGRRMRWWAVGLSVMATQISAITFVGTTGQAYTDGMRFLVVYFGLPFAMVALSLTLVPFFYRARVFTAYEYLETRFDGRTRTLTSLLFLLSRGLSVGVTLYAPSLVLSVVLGWSEPATILLMGGTTILYVSYGGNRSVIWTDVVQMAIIWLGIFLCLGVAIWQLPASFSLRDALAVSQAAGRLQSMDLSTDLRTPYTLWSGLIGGFFLAVSYFGCDQSQVQRYLSGSSLTQSRLSLLFNAFLKVPMQFMILLTGVLIFVFYHFHAPPLLWNRADEQRLETRMGKAAWTDLRSRYAHALAVRREAAETFALDRAGSGRAAAEARYRAAVACGGSCARRGRASDGVNLGRAGLQRHQLHLPELRRDAPPAWLCRSRDRRDLCGGDVDPLGGVQLAGDRDDGRLLQAIRPTASRSGERAPRLAAADGRVGCVRLRRGPRGWAARLRHRGRQQVRVVLLRLDPGRVCARRADAACRRARRLLRADRRYGLGRLRRGVHRGALPLVQRDRCVRRIQLGPRRLGSGGGQVKRTWWPGAKQSRTSTSSEQKAAPFRPTTLTSPKPLS